MIAENQMSNYLNTKRLAQLVRIKRGDRGLREIASITGVSPSTLSRVENEKTPDVDTFFTLCDWLEVPPAELIRNTENTQEPNKAKSICLKLRADSRLDPQVSNALAVLIEAAYCGALASIKNQ